MICLFGWPKDSVQLMTQHFYVNCHFAKKNLLWKKSSWKYRKIEDI